MAELALKHDLAVICNEVYERITFDGTEHVSIASLPGMRERTITIRCQAKTLRVSIVRTVRSRSVG